jgi:hypothetical protein
LIHNVNPIHRKNRKNSWLGHNHSGRQRKSNGFIRRGGTSTYQNQVILKITGQRERCGTGHQEAERGICRSQVELFIKRVEKIAISQKAGGRDVALQLPFMIKDRKISECIDYMEGHENCDWELLKKEIISKWGRATPKRQSDESSVSNLVSKYSDKGGIQTKEEYRTFIGKLEEILAYLTRMEYEDINAESREPFWRVIALEI